MLLSLFLAVLGLAVSSAQQLPHDIHKGRVIGGTSAGTGVYPFAAFLIVNEGGGTSAFCGGTIIDHQWILTAGHCVVAEDGGNKLTNSSLPLWAHRRSGHRWPKKTKSGGYPVISNKNIVCMCIPDLNLDYFDNDIAVLKLHSKLNFDEFVQPIRIDTNSVQDGMTVTGIGWGKTRLDQTVTSDVLQQVDLTIGNEPICSAIRPRFDSNNGNYICVSTPDGRDTCSGDSGGPLLRRCNDDLSSTGIQGTGPWVQLGITSYGDNVGHSDEAQDGDLQAQSGR
ncbi:trypsin-like serine protease [Linderina pennispora]|uniref:Trypsin-like serine protease n=1 Tax=Linderina pennispora TaxID=61395 RepID=A0A1Y1WES5_9FUNG|nr:trypsin-like serine protease [Linderina pennispora]ORX71664.1 trypsin-like serine protease [Linderina pennispora]